MNTPPVSFKNKVYRIFKQSFFIIFAATFLMGGFFVQNAGATVTSLILVAPNGSEQWRGEQPITWDAITDGLGGTVSIHLSTDGGVNYNRLIAGGVDATLESFLWNTTQTSGTLLNDGNTYRVRIQGDSGIDFSGANFTIDNTPPVTSITIPAPTGLDNWYTVVPSITLACVDDLSGCSTTKYRIDGGLWTIYAPFSITDGVHTLEFYSEDSAVNNAGIHNVETVQTQIIKVDTIAPTLVITMSDDALKAGETSLVTFTFSEAVTGFTNADITAIENGTLTPVSSSDGGTTWTATFTPTISIEDPTNIITVDKTGVIDVAGNTGLGTTNSPNYVIDTLRPTLFVGLSDVALKIGDTSVVTFTFSEAPTGFDVFDVTVENGSIGVIGGGPLIYTATLTPNAGVEDGTNIVTVGTSWTDAAGNTPLASAISSNYEVDTIAPIAVITYSDSDVLVKLGDNLTITATFNEPLAGVPVVNIALSGANIVAATAMTFVDSTHYTYMHIVGAGNGPVAIALSIGTDVAGNVVTSAPTSGATFTVDNMPPAVSITSIAGDNYINASEQTTVHVVGTAEVNSEIFVLLSDGFTTVGPVSSIAAGGVFDIVLNVSTFLDGVITPSVFAQDAAGNSGVADPIPTAIKDTVVATVLSITTTDANLDGMVDTATIVFTDEVNDSTIFANIGQFTIGGIVVTTFSTGTTANDNTVVLSHAGVAGTDAKMVIYTLGSATDLAGNLIAGFSQTSTDEAKPVLLSARTIDTTHLTATFSEDLNGTTVNDSGNEFAVNGTTVTDADETAPGIITLTYAPALGTGATPLVTYTQVDSLNDLASVPNTAVTPTTVTATDSVAPVLTVVSIISDNVFDTTLAKAGDVVTLTFTSSEAIATPTVLIASVSTDSVMNTGGNNWIATRLMNSGDAQGLIAISIAFEDTPAVNDGVIVTATTDFSMVFFDSVAPVVNAGTDKEINTTVSQDANVFDPDPSSGGLIYAWTMVSGPGLITFGTPAVEDTTISADTDGTYIIRLTVTDNAGNVSFNEMIFIWDTTAPIMILSIPADQAINVTVPGGTVKVKFDGDIGILNGSKVTLVRDSDNVSYLGTVSVQSGDDNSEILNITYEGLDNSTLYRVNIRPGAVRDTAGNAMMENRIFYFTSAAVPGDITAPEILSHTPNSDTTGVAVTIVPYLNFSEPLKATTVSSNNIKLKKYSDNSTVPAIVSLVEGGTQVNIAPSSLLENNTQYYFAVSNGVQDEVGNSLNPSSVLDESTKDDHTFTTLADNTVLAVTNISALKTFATADGTYENGWAWIFHITVPTNETLFAMKFADWTSVLPNTIPVANNVRYSSAQANNGPFEITAANVYGGELNLTGDLDPGIAGRQIQVKVEAKIPLDSAGGSYSTSYGVFTD